MSGSSGGPVTRTLAIVRQGRWPGWIWSVPLATVGIVIWLLVRQFSARGIEVTVMFDEAAQMDPDNTKVIERGVQIGKVRQVQLSRDGASVQVTLNIDQREKAQLNTGTRFYLEGATPELSDLSSLKGLLGGPTIDMMPGGGAPSRRFVGIEVRRRNGSQRPCLTG
jgi:paraquat-inducible protein B